MKGYFSGAFAFAVLLAALAQAQDYPAGQLPTTVTPTHYRVDLVTRPDQNAFSGEVTIDVTLAEPTRLIWLHGQDLRVREASVAGEGGKPVTATWREIPDSDGVASLTLANEVRGPKARITIKYDADYNRQLEGLYRADDAGEAYLYSQMETIFARRAFPSFDEPRFKTPYDISMTVRTRDTAISNAPIAKEAPAGDGLKKITFATTKPLPTYLIALIAGPFDVVQGPPVPRTSFRDREIPVRGIAAKGKGSQLKYALDNTPAILGALEGYFGTAYPYEKLDIIAVTDFAYGAMENAGAITYREQLLLMDEKSALGQRRSYALVHAHELAHQWFGNLVTPAWWNDIWLNEAFATWMGNKAAAAWDPNGEFGRLTLTGALGAMGTDSWHAARAIAQPIRSNDDIQNAFDGITYEKGGGVLAMFEQFYDAENFRKGVALHLERKAWGVATAREFLQSVADANKDTEGVAAFESFLNQPGVPLLTGRLECKGPSISLVVSQSRYFQGPATPEAKQQRWSIPTCVAFGRGPQRDQMCVIVKEPETRIALEAPGCPSWVMPNADGAGYFRFELDDAGWDGLTQSALALTDKEVLSLLDSMDAAFMAGRMSFDKYLARLRLVLTERQKAPGGITWDVANDVGERLSWFNRVLLPELAQPQLARIATEIYGPLYQRLGLDPTSDLDKSNPTQATLMRSPVVSAMAFEARAKDVRAELAKRGVAYVGVAGDGKVHPEAVDPDLLDEALNVAVQDRGPAFAQVVMTHFKAERNGFIRGRLLSALTRSTDQKVAAEVRALALNDGLRTNEIPTIVYGMMSERANRAAAWAWFKENFETLKKKTPPNNREGLVGVGSYFCTPAEAAEFEAFITPRVQDVRGAPRSLASTLERINSCTTLVEAQRPVAVKALAAVRQP
ncbi:MAG: M1 family metallopeptidase [Rhodospirillaceae bacterium]